MAGRRWEKSEIIALWKMAGVQSLETIAQSLGRTVWAVEAKARKEGIVLAQGTFTANQIAKGLGCSEKTVWGYIRRLGMRVKRRGTIGRGWAMLSEEQMEKIRRYHSTMGGWSQKNPFCVNCGRTDRRHHGKGLCRRCYERWRQVEDAGNPDHIKLRAIINQILDAIDGGQLISAKIKIDAKGVVAIQETKEGPLREVFFEKEKD